MHIQRQQMNDICPQGARLDLRGDRRPSVSACPDYYPSFDYCMWGTRDATDELDRAAARIRRPGGRSC